MTWYQKKRGGPPYERFKSIYCHKTIRYGQWTAAYGLFYNMIVITMRREGVGAGAASSYYPVHKTIIYSAHPENFTPQIRSVFTIRVPGSSTDSLNALPGPTTCGSVVCL